MTSPMPPRSSTAWGSASGSCVTRPASRSEEHTSELQSRLHLVCRLLLEKKKKKIKHDIRTSINASYYHHMAHPIQTNHDESAWKVSRAHCLVAVCLHLRSHIQCTDPQES